MPCASWRALLERRQGKNSESSRSCLSADTRWEAGKANWIPWERARMLAIRKIGKGCCCRIVSVAFVASLLMGTAAQADDRAPGALKLNFGTETFGWLVGEDGSTEFENGGYTFSGSDTGTGWMIDWNVMASGSEVLTSIVASLNVMNTSSTTQAYSIFFDDLIPLSGQNSFVGGSVGGMVIDLNGNGATLSSLTGKHSIYTGFVDATGYDPLTANIVGSLLTGESIEAGSFLAASFTPESFGNVPTIPGQTGPGIKSNVGFGLEFTLSAGDTAGFTASFAARVPSPGAVGLLGIAGLFGTRRRRRG